MLKSTVLAHGRAGGMDDGGRQYSPDMMVVLEMYYGRKKPKCCVRVCVCVSRLVLELRFREYVGGVGSIPSGVYGGSGGIVERM